MKMDRHGNIWLAGITYSHNLPIRNPFQGNFGGGNGNGFVAVFRPDLKGLCFSSYHGGRDRTLLEGLAISASGMIAVTGVSFSEGPSPLHIQIGRTAISAGALMLLFRADIACPD